MDNATELAVDGAEITLAKKTYTLPALPLKYMPKVKKLLEGGDPQEEEYITAMTDAIFYSLKRNYPTLQREVVEDNIDMTNFAEILMAFQTANKLNAAVPGEVTASQ